MTPARARLLVSGRVQGVCYRASAQDEGIRLGLCGEVKNLPSGQVEATVEGPRAAVEEFIAWCQVGPPAARVSDVAVEWSEFKGEFGRMRIVR